MKIGASLLSIPVLSLNDKIINLLSSDIDYFHVDIMDGNFVPNLAYTPDWVNQIKVNHPNISIGLHFMTTETALQNLFPGFQACKPERMSFHYEAVNNPSYWITKIKNNNIKAGIAICPETPVEVIYPFLEIVSFVLVMSVKPGFGGQKFIEETYRRINKLVKIRKQNNLHFELQVDGGIQTQNAIQLIRNGVDLLVIGSYLTKTTENPISIVHSIKEAQNDI